MSGGPVAFVDDDPDLRRATAQMLRLAGFEVHAFDGAEAALVALDASFGGPVVTDIRMPRMNGLQLFERLKGETPDLKALMICYLAIEGLRSMNLFDSDVLSQDERRLLVSSLLEIAK